MQFTFMLSRYFFLDLSLCWEHSVCPCSRMWVTFKLSTLHLQSLPMQPSINIKIDISKTHSNLFSALYSRIDWTRLQYNDTFVSLLISLAFLIFSEFQATPAAKLVGSVTNSVACFSSLLPKLMCITICEVFYPVQWLVLPSCYCLFAIHMATDSIHLIIKRLAVQNTAC